jgi:hypothetical protein
MAKKGLITSFSTEALKGKTVGVRETVHDKYRLISMART